MRNSGVYAATGARIGVWKVAFLWALVVAFKEPGFGWRTRSDEECNAAMFSCRRSG